MFMCSDWDPLYEKVWDRFSALEDKTQIEFIQAICSKSFHIFKMKDFDAFFAKHEPSSYFKIADAAIDGSACDEFHPKDTWCCWDEDMLTLRSGDTPTAFIDNDEGFIEGIIDNYDLLDSLCFTDREEAEIREAYNRISKENEM